MTILPADPRHSLYRDALDPDATLRITAQTLKNCDDGELYLQYLTSESFGFDDGRLKTADYNTQAGFGLRGVSGETTAFAHANELSEAAILRAGETMTLLDPATAGRSPPPRRTNSSLYTPDNPLGLIPFAPLAPGIAVVFFGLGMVARDGLWLLLGPAFLSGAIWLAMQVIL